jgi:hypothetical protein
MTLQEVQQTGGTLYLGLERIASMWLEKENKDNQGDKLYVNSHGITSHHPTLLTLHIQRLDKMMETLQILYTHLY